MVVAGRKPCRQVLPPLREVAQPMLAAAPMNTRPTWKADTMVDPAAKESGSTSVWCAEKVLVYGSALRWISRRAGLASAGAATTAARSRDTSRPTTAAAGLDREGVVHILRSFAATATAMHETNTPKRDCQ